MANVKFGLDQIKNQTPQTAKNVFRVVLYTAAAINILLMFIPDIPLPIKEKILQYCGLVVPACHMFSKLFGIDISDIDVPKI